jgi:hypothetical protein
VGAFADSLIDELSAVGNSLVMPTLNSKIKDLFGFDFSDMLEEIGRAKSRAGQKRKGDSRASFSRARGKRSRGGTGPGKATSA